MAAVPTGSASAGSENHIAISLHPEGSVVPADSSDTLSDVTAVHKVVPGGEGMTNAGTQEEELVETLALATTLKPRKTGVHLFYSDIWKVWKLDELGKEVLTIAVPAALALAADPLASLIDTAFIGRLGSVEIGAVGVSIAIFNQVSKICIYPLVSVTTSFVAEEDALLSKSLEEEKNEDVEKAPPADGENKEQIAKDEPPTADPSTNGSSAPQAAPAASKKMSSPRGKKRYVASASSALIVGAMLGLIQAIFLILGAKLVLSIMGVKHGSPMLKPALKYLTLRSLGAPAVLLSLAMQGIFRGFKDTKTPLYATVAGDLANIILDPILMFVFHMGVSGAAVAHALSQYLITLILLFRLVQRIDIVPPSIKSLKLSRFLKCGFHLLARVIAATFCVTLAASMAAHQGAIRMAAFQICLQLWMSTSLLADGLAVAGQAILANSFAKGDHQKVVLATARVLQLSILLGMILTVVIGIGGEFGSGVFTKDISVQKIIHRSLPFVAGTQIINSLAFVFDGINFGASDYTFAGYSMVAVAAISVPCVIFLSKAHGFIGIWIAMTIFMSLRTLTSISRMALARGPWSFLRR